MYICWQPSKCSTRWEAAEVNPRLRIPQQLHVALLLTKQTVPRAAGYAPSFLSLAGVQPSDKRK